MAKTLPSVNDERYDYVLERLENGKITRFGEILKFVPKTIISADMGMKVDRWNRYYFKEPSGFKFGQFFKLARKINVDPWLLIRLFEQELKYNATEMDNKH